MDENYGINKKYASKKALELIPDDFFWDCSDELAPFGSDEGDTALAEYRRWRQDNPQASIVACLTWLIEGLTEEPLEKYNRQSASQEYIARQLENDDFDDDYYIYVLDASVIATGFGQLVDEGLIEAGAIPLISIALERQINWASLDENSINLEYIGNIKKLQDVLAILKIS